MRSLLFLAWGRNKKKHPEPAPEPVVYTSTKSATASCPEGSTGSSVTASATRTSSLSQVDADTQAQAAATAEAESRLVCAVVPRIHAKSASITEDYLTKTYRFSAVSHVVVPAGLAVNVSYLGENMEPVEEVWHIPAGSQLLTSSVEYAKSASPTSGYFEILPGDGYVVPDALEEPKGRYDLPIPALDLAVMTVAEDHTHDQVANKMSVVWRILFPKGFTGEVEILVSDSVDGAVRPRKVAVSGTSWSSTYVYELDRFPNLAELSLEVVDAPSYNIGSPERVAVDVSAFTQPEPQPAPTNLTLTQQDRVVVANWTPGSPIAPQQAEQSTDGVSWTLLQSLEPSTASLEILVPDGVQRQWFRVKTLGNGTTTADSPYVEESIELAAAPDPTGPVVVNAYKGTVVHDTAFNTMTIGFGLSLTEGWTGGIVNVEYSDTADGIVKPFQRTVAPDATDSYVDVVYDLRNLIGMTEVEFSVLAGTGYELGAAVRVTEPIPAWQLKAATEFGCVVSGKTLLITFQPDAYGVSQELRIKNLTTLEEVIVPLSLSASNHTYTGVYATGYSVEHRTIGDGITTITSPWVYLERVTEAAPVVKPDVSYTTQYIETDPTKLWARYVLTFNPAPPVDLLLNIVVSDPSTGEDGSIAYPIPAGTTTKSLNWHYTYSALNPGTTKVAFQLLSGEGYTSLDTTRKEHTLNYTPPEVPVSMIPIDAIGARGGIYGDQVQDTSLGYRFKYTGSLDFQQHVVMEWNLAAQDMPTSLRLHISNYMTVTAGTVEVYEYLNDLLPETDTFNSTIGGKGALLGSATFAKGETPFVTVNLGQLTLAAGGPFRVFITGTGFASGEPYLISRIDSANAPTLLETPVSSTYLEITSVGTPDGTDDALLASAITKAQQAGKTLRIATELVIHNEVRSDLNDVHIYLDKAAGGKISGYTPYPYMNDWKRDKLTGALNGYTWTQANTAGTPAYNRRQEAYNCGKRLLTLNGARCSITGWGEIDGKYNNTGQLSNGAKKSTELVGIYGDGFVGRFVTRNAPGYACELVSNNCDVEVEDWDSGYTGLRPNAQRNLDSIKISFTGGKTSTSPTSRTSCLTLNGTNTLGKAYFPKVKITNGTFLIEGVVGDGVEGANTPFFQDVEIGTMDVTLETPYQYEWGQESSYHCGKFENVGSVLINYLKARSTLRGCGAPWLDKLGGTLEILEMDTNLQDFRPGRNTTIHLSRHVRTMQAEDHHSWYDISGNYRVHIEKLVIENNGMGNLPSGFGIFNIGETTPDITVGEVVNNGGATVNLARLKAAAGSGTIRFGTGLSVAQQKTMLAGVGVLVDSARSRLLAAS